MTNRCSVICLIPLVIYFLSSCASGGNSKEAGIDDEYTNDPAFAKNALIVFNPGYSDFQHTLTRAFANGLREKEWRVKRITAGVASSAELPDFDLLIVSANTYWWSPDRKIMHFQSSVQPLDNRKVVGLLTAAGASGSAERLLKRYIEDAGGDVLRIQSYWILKPNDERDKRPNRIVALEKAFNFAKSISVE